MKIINGKIFNGLQFIEEKNITIIDDKITSVTNNYTSDFHEIDASGLYIVPGFIDIHTHGIAGYDINEISTNLYPNIINSYLKNGTTSFLPSTVSQDAHKTLQLLSYLQGDKKNKCMLGAHLEAPYINKNKLGAQNKNFIEIPSIDNFKKTYQKYYNEIKRVTLAPELDHNYQLIKYLVNQSIAVSFGHTMSDSVTGEQAFDAGVSLATHFMNAMPQIHHRECGITGKALLRDDVYVEIISDLHHVSADIIKLIIKVKPIDKIIIISDSMSAATLSDGEYELSGQKVIVKNNTARLIEGNLAGSLITMHDGVKNYVKIGIELEKAIQFATYNPAKYLKLENKIGMIKCGNDADLLLLDQHLNIKKVISKGKEI